MRQIFVAGGTSPCRRATGLTGSVDRVVKVDDATQLDARIDIELLEDAPEMPTDGVMGDEEMLGGLSIRQALCDETRDGEFSVGERGPTASRTRRGDQAAADAQSSKPAPHPGGIPGGAGPCEEPQRPAERIDPSLGFAGLHARDGEILQCRGQEQRTRATVEERNCVGEILFSAMQEPGRVR